MLWGSTFVVVKDALADASPILYLAIRFAVAALLLLPIVFLQERRMPSRRMLWGGLATGACLGVGMILQTVGLKYTSASNSGFLTSLYIPLVPFVASAVYGVRTGWRERIAVGLASCGIALMSFDPSSFTMNFGDGLTVGCALVFSVQIVMVKHFADTGETAWLAWLQVSATAILASIAAFLRLDGPSYLVMTPRLYWAFAITILGATVVAFLLQSWGQRQTSASRAALVFATEPVFAGIASYFYLDERLSARAWIGAALVFTGVLLAELKPRGER